MTERYFQTDFHYAYDDVETDAPARDGSVILWAGIGLAGAAVTGCVVAGLLLMDMPGHPAPAAPEPRVVLRTHPDIRPAAPQAVSGTRLLAEEDVWMFAPGIAIGTRRFASTVPTVDGFQVTPLPPVNPVAVRQVPDLFAEAPLPARNPLSRDRGQSGPKVASLPPSGPDNDHVPYAATEVALPTPGSGYAIYDIKGKTVYMPNGERLEAHSGLGDMFDDPRHVSKRMRGPTPPNVYNLTPREALFHGVEALRMKPVDSDKMYGRDGILAHTYLLGPRGDSNGCVSFKNYDKFLAAYKRGEITQLIVVADLANAPPRNPLLALFSSN